MAKTMEHLSDFAFVSMYNFTLIRRDSYLAHVKSGIKQDTLAALRQAPMDLDTLFRDTVLTKAEEDISKFEDRGQSHTGSSNHNDTRFHPYKRSDKPYQDNKPARHAWKNIGCLQKKKTRFQTNKYPSRQARGQASFKWQSMHSSVSRESDQETGQRANFSNRTRIRTDCKLCSKTGGLCTFKCCFSCTYCNRAATKERHKSSLCKTKQSSVIKACEQCFLCRSFVFCKLCTKCRTCCTKSSCRGQANPFLGGLGRPRSWSQSPSNVERGLHPTFPDKTKFDQVSNNCKLLCTSPQESRPVRGIASAYKEKGSRTSPKSNISGVLQQTIFSPKTKQQMETYTGPELSQSIPQGRKIQNGNPGNNTNLTTSRGVG